MSVERLVLASCQAAIYLSEEIFRHDGDYLAGVFFLGHHPARRLVQAQRILRGGEVVDLVLRLVNSGSVFQEL